MEGGVRGCGEGGIGGLGEMGRGERRAGMAGRVAWWQGPGERDGPSRRTGSEWGGPRRPGWRVLFRRDEDRGEVKFASSVRSGGSVINR